MTLDLPRAREQQPRAIPARAIDQSLAGRIFLLDFPRQRLTGRQPFPTGYGRRLPGRPPRIAGRARPSSPHPGHAHSAEHLIETSSIPFPRPGFGLILSAILCPPELRRLASLRLPRGTSVRSEDRAGTLPMGSAVSWNCNRKQNGELRRGGQLGGRSRGRAERPGCAGVPVILTETKRSVRHGLRAECLVILGDAGIPTFGPIFSYRRIGYVALPPRGERRRREVRTNPQARA